MEPTLSHPQLRIEDGEILPGPCIHFGLRNMHIWLVLNGSHASYVLELHMLDVNWLVATPCI